MLTASLAISTYLLISKSFIWKIFCFINSKYDSILISLFTSLEPLNMLDSYQLSLTSTCYKNYVRSNNFLISYVIKGQKRKAVDAFSCPNVADYKRWRYRCRSTNKRIIVITSSHLYTSGHFGLTFFFLLCSSMNLTTACLPPLFFDHLPILFPF